MNVSDDYFIYVSCSFKNDILYLCFTFLCFMYGAVFKITYVAMTVPNKFYQIKSKIKFLGIFTSLTVQRIFCLERSKGINNQTNKLK
jgi:hypothetical protein